MVAKMASSEGRTKSRDGLRPSHQFVHGLEVLYPIFDSAALHTWNKLPIGDMIQGVLMPAFMMGLLALIYNDLGSPAAGDTCSPGSAAYLVVRRLPRAPGGCMAGWQRSGTCIEHGCLITLIPTRYNPGEL